MLNAANPARDRGIALLREAWGFEEEDPFHSGRPAIPEMRLPYGVVRLDSVPRGFNGARSVEEILGYQFCGFFAIPEGVDLEALKVERAQQAGTALLSSNWAEVDCYAPEVTSIEFVEEEDPEPYFAVVVAFAVKSDVFQ